MVFDLLLQAFDLLSNLLALSIEHLLYQIGLYWALLEWQVNLDVLHFLRIQSSLRDGLLTLGREEMERLTQNVLNINVAVIEV